MTGWTVTGDAFSVTAEPSWGGGSYNQEGIYHVRSGSNGDDQTGSLTSANFDPYTDGGVFVDFLISGGDDIDNLYVALYDTYTNQVLYKATGTNSEEYRRVSWQIPYDGNYFGKGLQFIVVDNSAAGHINVDEFRTSVQISNAPENQLSLANHDFETGDLTGWTVMSGTAFSVGDVTYDSTYWGGPFHQNGNYHLWSFKENGDADTGVLRSQYFTLSGTGQIDFLISGGNDINNLYVALVLSSGNEVFKATGSDSEQFTRVTWDASRWIGYRCYIKVVDNATGGWGHINLDDVNL